MTPLRERAEQVFGQLHAHPYYNEDKEADIAAIHAALEQVREDCCTAVREGCSVCSGTGIAETRHHDVIEDDGRGNPVLTGVDEEYIECEYCGRPIHAIRQQEAR